MGQGQVSSVGNLMATSFPLTSSGTGSNNYHAMALMVPMGGMITRYSAVLKGPSANTIVNVYLAAEDASQYTIRLLNPIGPTGPIPIRLQIGLLGGPGVTGVTGACGSLIINAPIFDCETLCPFVEPISQGSYDGIAVSAVYEG